MTKTMALTIEETDDAVIIKKDGVEIDLGPNHSVVVHTDGDVKVQPAATNDTAIKAAKDAPEVGDKMSDGSIFAGISTGKQMFAAPQDAKKADGTNLTMTFNEAADYAKKLNAENYLGHNDWRVPTKAELNVLFNNRAAIGKLDISGSSPSGWYWSGTPSYDNKAYGQRFSDGYQDRNSRNNGSSVRCVR
jgi:hypothetical protein